MQRRSTALSLALLSICAAPADAVGLVLGSANGENSLIAAALKKRLDELDWKVLPQVF